jgi:hypothetical protein
VFRLSVVSLVVSGTVVVVSGNVLSGLELGEILKERFLCEVEKTVIIDDVTDHGVEASFLTVVNFV